jgi:hypothetical protein
MARIFARLVILAGDIDAGPAEESHYERVDARACAQAQDRPGLRPAACSIISDPWSSIGTPTIMSKPFARVSSQSGGYRLAIRIGMLTLTLAMSSPALGSAPPDVKAVAADSNVHKIGLCRVRILTSSAPSGATRARSFLIDVGARRLVVAPTAATSVTFRGPGRRIDAVLLTSLSETALGGHLQDATAAYGGSRIFVDRALLEATAVAGQRVDRRNLDALLSSGRLYAPEANVDVLPGIRFTIPPQRSAESRVKIRCGDQTLIVLDGGELASSGFDRIPAIPLNGDDPAHLRSLAGDRTTLAITNGPFPALASIYRHVDGFRLGPIEAKEYGGALPRRGEVIVEDTPLP